MNIRQILAEEKKALRVFHLRDILIVVSLVLNVRWMVVLAFAFWLISVILQLRKDWKTYRKFDVFTIAYICIASGIIFLIVFPWIRAGTM